MSFTFGHIEDMADIRNTTLNDLAWACIGDEGTIERVKPDHIGGLLYAGRSEYSVFAGTAEFLVVSYPGAGLQLFIGTDHPRDSVMAIDLHVAADRNDDPALLAAIRDVLDQWWTDGGLNPGDILANPAEIYIS